MGAEIMMNAFKKLSTDMTMDYKNLINEAMYGIVKKCLLSAAKQEVDPNKNHFCITFDTNNPGVSISQKLKLDYKDVLTMVIQHQFEALEVNQDSFSVDLRFQA